MTTLIIFSFIDYILIPYYTKLSLFLATNIRFLWILIVFFTSILFLILYLIRNLKLKYKILYASIYTLIFIFLIYIPFQRGKEIESLTNLGFKIYNDIEKYKIKTNKTLKDLDELYPEYINENEKKVISKHFKYWYSNKDTINEANKKNNGFIPWKEDYYSITINIEFLGPFFIRLNNKTRDFKITDN